MNPAELTLDEMERWLREEDDRKLEELWEAADRTRREHVGDAVHLRGLIEISNYCVRQCGYCGLRSDHHGLQRYRMTEEEIMACVGRAVEFGYGTVVMQSGEDYAVERDRLSRVIRQIKAETRLAVTLSLGVLTSMFTAVAGTRTLLDLWYGKRKIERLSIGLVGRAAVPRRDSA